jgi:hypothetical protein
MQHNLLDSDIKHQLLTWKDIITKQNYFTNTATTKQNFHKKIWIGNESPQLLTSYQEYKIINYFRYVDDIFLKSVSDYTNIHTILAGHNVIHPNFQFTGETEQNNTIN